jgi:NarL family two-component system response regulator LiaR
MRVVIVEDHPLIRTGLRTSLQAMGIDVVGEAEDGVTGLALIREMRPELAIIDLGLPGKDGLSLLSEVKAGEAPPRVVVLTMREQDDDVLAAVAAGADGYCAKSSGHHVVMDAVRTVAAGGAYFDPRIAHVVLKRLSGVPAMPEESPLNRRERAILRMISEGVGNTEIANRTGMPLGTVKTSISDILRKLGASDRAHAAAIALRGGFL